MTPDLFSSPPQSDTDERAKVMRLTAGGVSGTATITEIRRTGVLVGGNPECEIDLRVVIGGGAPYAATARQTLAPVAIPHFQPGREVPVKVDPLDRLSLIIA